MTGGGYDGTKITPLLFQSITSDKPLPKNPEAYKQLQSKSNHAAQVPKPGPAGIVGISFFNREYKLEPNSIRLEKIMLRNGEVKLTLLGSELTVPVGLDGVYRTSPAGLLGIPLGAMGAWSTEKDFMLDLNFIANINHYTFAMKFYGNQLEILANEASGLAKNLKITGRSY